MKFTNKVVCLPLIFGIVKLTTVQAQSIHLERETALTEHKPTIWVSTRSGNSQVMLLVRDKEIGILPEVMNKVFQPFFTTKSTGVGAGVDLSLS